MEREGYIDSIFESRIGPELTVATDDIRNSKDFFARQMIEGLNIYLEKNPSPKTDIDVKDAITRTASIAHDMIIFRASNASSWGISNWVTGRATSIYLGGHKPLADLVEKIYTRTFRREIMNLNLITRTTDALVIAFQKKSNDVEREKLANALVEVA